MDRGVGIKLFAEAEYTGGRHAVASRWDLGDVQSGSAGLRSRERLASGELARYSRGNFRPGAFG